MTELDYLKYRLAINENFLAEVVETMKRSCELTNVGLWNGLNVAKGHAALAFKELHEEFAKQQAEQPRIQVIE